MKNYISTFGLIFTCASFLLAGCSSDPITDSLSIGYGSSTVTMTKTDGKPVVSANIIVKLVNRTQRGMNIAFIEATMYDATTNRALVRFRPIIPDSYGSISTASLLPKQSKDFQVVTPVGLEGFDPGITPKVTLKILFQTTDGYRTEVASGPISVASK